MPLRAITSERPCASHPLGRSPGAALHQGGGALPSHGFTGDWARLGIGKESRNATSATQSTNSQGFLIATLLSRMTGRSRWTTGSPIYKTTHQVSPDYSRSFVNNPG
jgi:hypothetical protein